MLLKLVVKMVRNLHCEELGSPVYMMNAKKFLGCFNAFIVDGFQAAEINDHSFSSLSGCNITKCWPTFTFFNVNTDQLCLKIVNLRI